MKIKSLIKLICLLVVLVALSVWAFGANVSLLGKKFIAWDENMIKGNDIGRSAVMVFTISAPKDQPDLDVHAAAINAVDVFTKRAELIGYDDISVRVMGTDSVYVTTSLDEAELKSGIGLLAYNGKLSVTKDAKVVFTEKDIKSVKYTGLNDMQNAYCVDVVFTDEAKAKVKEFTSNGAYTFKFALDTDVATVTVTGSEMIKNGKMTLEFTDSSAFTFIYCLQSGAVDGEINWSGDIDYIVDGTAGENAIKIFGLCALAIILIAAIYFVLANKMLGLAAAISTFIGVLGYEFFAATFTWLTVNAEAVAGMCVVMLFMVFAHALVLNNVSSQYATGKDVVSALDAGVLNSRKIVIEVGLVATVLGLGLWIIDAGFASFGIAVMGGALIAIIASLFVLKFVAKIFIGLGANSAKAFGLKRGE